jgi:hypothetical protein
MAKFTFLARLGKYGELSDFFNTNKLELDAADDTHVIYVDKQGGEKIKIYGEDLAVNKQGVVTGGTIDEVTFSTRQGQPFVKITDADASAKVFFAQLQQHGLDGALEFALKGNDKLIGSLISDELYGGTGKDKINGGGGEDHIEGGAGNDQLTGGKSSDTFIFNQGDGKDTITDFDPIGNNRAQDYIRSNDSTFEIIDAGNNTIIEFGGGDQITLIGVKHADITTDDFIL